MIEPLLNPTYLIEYLQSYYYYIYPSIFIILIINIYFLFRYRKIINRQNIKLIRLNASYIQVKKLVRSLSAKIKIHNKFDNKKFTSTKHDSDFNIAPESEKNKILSRELNQWKQRVSPLIDKFKKLSNENKRLQKELSEAQRIISTINIMQSPDETKTVINLNNYRSRDDLQSIRGIGSSIEKILNKYDIFRYQQIADITEYEINLIANDIKGLKSQIYREDWIGQAEYFCSQDIKKSDS